MTEVTQTYGKNLPDQVDRVAALFDSHNEVVSDIRDLYRHRVALDREYAGKLQILARSAAEKKAKMEAAFVLGDEPTKTWGEQDLKQNTLNTAFNEIIDSMLFKAQDSMDLSDALTTQVTDVLKVLERRNDELKKKEMGFFQKLLAERDRTDGERIKAKQKYDAECGEVDAYRQKQAKTSDDKHAERIAKQADQERDEMMNAKNTYIIATAAANSTKTKFYLTDLPELEDQFQQMQSRLVARFSKIVGHAQALQLSHIETSKQRISRVEGALNAVDPVADQNLFIEHNIRPFAPPPDFKFEYCANFYDTEEMNVEPAPKVFLQNRLGKSQASLGDLGPVLENKQREYEKLAKLVAAYNADKSLGNIDEVAEQYLDARHQLAHFRTSETILNTEIETILSAVGDDIGGGKPHSFKSSSFSIPTTCGYCKSSIWGLSKQGKTCKGCGLSVHSKCELKVPADCAKSTGLVSRNSTVRRAPPNASTGPTPSSFVRSPPVEEEEASYPTAKILYTFEPSSNFELGVTEGSMVQVVEPDDGSGWVKVLNKQGRDGLVPSSYVEYAEEGAASSGPQSNKQRVTAIYSYAAQGPDELALVEGETIELTEGPNGGQNYADGWWEGVNGRGSKGIFPSNYVEMA